MKTKTGVLAISTQNRNGEALGVQDGRLVLVRFNSNLNAVEHPHSKITPRRALAWLAQHPDAADGLQWAQLFRSISRAVPGRFVRIPANITTRQASECLLSASEGLKAILKEEQSQ